MAINHVVMSLLTELANSKMIVAINRSQLRRFGLSPIREIRVIRG